MISMKNLTNKNGSEANIPPHDGAKPVRGESTRQDADVSERRFERLVEDVGDLVLEVLNGDEWVEQFATALA
jgi:hypothetical protein